jgi:Rod binding domain-containing protein
VSGIEPAGGPRVPEKPLSPQRAKLREAAHQLEGIFLSQLFQAMRQTVPASDSPDAAGREMFTSMMDDELAARAADRLHRGLGEALYRQLSRRLPEE